MRYCRGGLGETCAGNLRTYLHDALVDLLDGLSLPGKHADDLVLGPMLKMDPCCVHDKCDGVYVVHIYAHPFSIHVHQQSIIGWVDPNLSNLPASPAHRS